MKCGSCKACCTVLGVTGKAPYTPCKHLTQGSAGGCGIYKQRPDECSRYKCLALVRNRLSWRPDKIGMILEPTDTKIGPAIVVREVWQGAFDFDTVAPIAQQDHAFIYLIRPNNTRILFFPRSE